MNLVMRLGAALVFGGFLLYVVHLVSKGKLLLKYSLLWIFLCSVVLICDLFPGIVYFVSDAVGFVTPSNFTFLVAIVLLLLICLSLSVAVSRHVMAVKNLTQRVALLEKQLEFQKNDLSLKED